MKFKKLEIIKVELEKITGKKWFITPALRAKEDKAFTYVNSYDTFDNTKLADYRDLPQNTRLSMADLETFLYQNNKTMQSLKLRQFILLEDEDAHNHSSYGYSFALEREFPLNYKLKDGTTIAENLENFSWSYNWTKGYKLSQFLTIPSKADVTITSNANDKIFDFLDQLKISSTQFEPVAGDDLDLYLEMQDIIKQVFENIKKANNNILSSDNQQNDIQL